MGEGLQLTGGSVSQSNTSVRCSGGQRVGGMVGIYAFKVLKVESVALGGNLTPQVSPHKTGRQPERFTLPGLGGVTMLNPIFVCFRGKSSGFAGDRNEKKRYSDVS